MSKNLNQEPLSSPRALRFPPSSQSDFISFRHHTYTQTGGPSTVDLKEVGPRFEAKIFQITLGTVDQPHAEKEWALRSYTKSAKKPKLADPVPEED